MSESLGTSNSDDSSPSVGDQLLILEKRLAQELLLLSYPDNVATIYNPIDYAVETHSSYIKKYGNSSPKKILFLGMNPGPWGMAQTGVPFGHVGMVKDWLKVDGTVGKPANEHPKRPIEGFACKRSEVSGERFWTFVKSVCSDPDAFAANCIVYNHCPLIYMGSSGKNITPVEMKMAFREKVMALCDEALAKVLMLYKIEHLVCLGRFAEDRANKVVKNNNAVLGDIHVHFLIHPSPASPTANKGWNQLALSTMEKADLLTIMRGN